MGAKTITVTETCNKLNIIEYNDVFWLNYILVSYRWEENQFLVKASWNMTAHAQKPDFVFRRNGRVHLNRWGRQFSRLLAAEVCASAVVMLDTPCSEVVWRVLAIHSIRQFSLHFPSRASPCAITFQLDSTLCLVEPSYILSYRLTAAGQCHKNRELNHIVFLICRNLRPTVATARGLYPQSHSTGHSATEERRRYL
jgi:hypothetical protein